MLKKFIFILFLLSSFSGQLLYCEELTGVVRDADTGHPLDSASVYLLNRTVGKYSGPDGFFVLQGLTAGSDTLICRRIGYTERRLPVSIPGRIEVLIDAEPVELEEVVVRSLSPSELPASERTTASVTVVEREDIPERSLTLDHVLDSQAGVDIRTMGGEGAKSDISIRGSTSEQVAVYLDGVPLTAGGSGVSGLSQVPLSRVKNIEVYRGSSPGAFGAGAIGGVVNISTVPPDDAKSLNGSLSYGSFNTSHLSVAGSMGVTDNQRISLSINRSESDNDFEFLDDRGTYLDDSDDGWETRKNADLLTQTFTGGWDAKVKSDARFRSSLMYRSIDRGVCGLGRRPAYHARHESENLFWQGRFDWKNALTAQAWISRENRLFFDPDDEAGRRGRQKTDTDIDVEGVQAQYNYAKGLTLTHLRAEYRRETYESSDSYQSDLTLPSQRKLAAVGAETEIFLFDGVLLMQPRIHYKHIDDSIQDVGNFVGVVGDFRSKKRDSYTTALGIRYRPVKTVTVRANAGLYTREPDFNELFGDTGDVVGNTELTSEKSLNIDSGVSFDLPSFWPDIDVTAFYRKADDLIQRRNYGDYLVAENIAKARIIGIENGLNGKVGWHNTSYRMSFSYQEALNKSDATLFRKNRYYNKFLPYHPEWQFDGGVKLDLVGQLRLGWKVGYESECYRGPSNLDEEMIEERILHDLSLEYPLRQNINASFEIVNLSDKQYVDRWGYPRPGRAFYLSFSWELSMKDSKGAE